MTSLDSFFVSHLRCPKTGGELVLSADNTSLATPDNQHSYPVLDGVPWLLPNPRNSLLDWGAKLHHFQQVLLQEIAQLEVDAKSAASYSRARLQKMLDAKKTFLMQVTELFQPLARAPVAEKAIYDVLRDRAPNTQNLLSYEANIYRDWQWGDAENALTADLVYNIMPGDIGKLAVLGAGACRLALDIHTRKPRHEKGTAITIATDINPLFLLAVRKLLSKNNLPLVEFPLHPKSVADTAVAHTLRGLTDTPDNFHICFADVAQPPFPQYAFDTVLTPWLIDIQPLALTTFLAQLNQYLPIGGVWVNFGSLVFQSQRDAMCYQMDEVADMAHHAGFVLECHEQHEIPYLKSPYNAGYRMENVCLWRAVKKAHVAPMASDRVQVVPAWLRDLSLPVPRFPEIEAYVHQNTFLLDVFAQINDKHSLKSICRKMAKKYQLSDAELETLLQNYLLEIEQSRHKS